MLFAKSDWESPVRARTSATLIVGTDISWTMAWAPCPFENSLASSRPCLMLSNALIFVSPHGDDFLAEFNGRRLFLRRQVCLFVLCKHRDQENRHIVNPKTQTVLKPPLLPPPSCGIRTFRKPPPGKVPASGFSAIQRIAVSRSASVMIDLARSWSSGSSATVRSRDPKNTPMGHMSMACFCPIDG